ncbi:hypothetical protein MBLNU230_g4673t1 [Neophaeotheca triangularis]
MSDKKYYARNYREREREDNYRGGGRDRRDDRGWERGGGDRDRGSARRDARRDDDRRAPRRDRDLFDDRRAPRDHDRREDRGDRMRDQDDMRQLERSTRQKSGTPPRKVKEPTPDLTGVQPIHKRQRRLTQWDVKPPGYEKVTAEQAKLSGMFPLPGAPRQQTVDPARLNALINQPGGSANSSVLKPGNARQSKRLFVYNIPANADNQYVKDFFNLQLNGTNVTQDQDPCISAHVSSDGSYALLEFKTSEDATHAMALDTISMDAGANMNGDGPAESGISIKRPKDYIVPAVTDETEVMEGTTSDIVPDTQYKISITNIPTYIDEDQVRELLSPFGELKNFVLVKDTSSGASRGIAFAEYRDAKTSTDIAIKGVDGMELGEKPLKMQRASIGIQQGPAEMSVGAMSMMAATKQDEGADTSRVIKLMNMVTAGELVDDEDAAEIEEDVYGEVVKYGKVAAMKIPRPSSGSKLNNGVGKIFIKYEEPESAQKALRALAGRKFAERTVVATFFGEEYFDTEAW